MWDVLEEIAVDASSQATVRTAFRDWLLIYQNARRAWGEIVTGRYALKDFVWPPPGTSHRQDDGQSYEEMEAELGEFCLALERPAATAFGLMISGKASMEAVRELVRDFIHLDATRNIAGQLTRLDDGSRAFRAIAQAFATESGGYLTRNHMEIWADFCEQALGITREDLFTWIPPTETIASRYVTSWFLVHSAPEEAIAAFHLGPPTRAKEQMGKRALGLARAASRRRPHRRRDDAAPPPLSACVRASQPISRTTLQAARRDRAVRAGRGLGVRAVTGFATARSAGASSAPTSRRSSPNDGRTKGSSVG